jgi:NAD(P)-dependent dehydrogenase (short-subunit alcohol dehydrogenase family)
VPLPGAAVYTATKHAAVGLTEAVRAELRGSGVRLTAVLPWFAATDVVAGLPLRRAHTVTPERVAGDDRSGRVDLDARAAYEERVARLVGPDAGEA